MKPTARMALGAILAALAVLGVGAATRAPWTATPMDLALLRLSWRAQSETTEECRPLTEEEKAELPVHMQVPEVCESRAVPYRLRVSIDGSEILADTVHGSGAREDRPIYVLRDIALSPGRHAIEIEFAPIRGRGRDGQREDEERDTEEASKEEDEEDEEAKAIPLAYAETIVVGNREVALVTYDPTRRALVRVVGP